MKSDFGVYFLFWIPPVMPYGLCINNIERGIFHLLVSLISLCSWVCVYFHMLPNWFNHTYITFFFASCSIASLLSIPSSLLHFQTNVFKDLCMHGPYFLPLFVFRRPKANCGSAWFAYTSTIRSMLLPFSFQLPNELDSQKTLVLFLQLSLSIPYFVAHTHALATSSNTKNPTIAKPIDCPDNGCGSQIAWCSLPLHNLNSSASI